MDQKPQSKILVLWVIWLAMVSAIVIYQFTLGHGIPAGVDDPSVPTNPIIYFAIVQLALVAFIRWVLVRRTKEQGKLLVLMVVGLALSEAVEFYGLFLVPPEHPQTKLILWMLALLSAVQFMPLYAVLDRSDRIPA